MSQRGAGCSRVRVAALHSRRHGDAHSEKATVREKERTLQTKGEDTVN
jgi:phosphohistidine phosphatase SixA